MISKTLLSAMLSLILAGVPALGQAAIDASTTSVPSPAVTSVPAAVFAAWRQNSPTPAALTSYVRSVTDAASPDYIPLAERIAVFDIDGTLLSETTPFYVDWTSWIDWTLNPKNTHAAESDVIYAHAARAAMEKGEKLPTYQGNMFEAIARGYAGLSPNEFREVIAEFSKTNNPKGIAYRDSFFKPMVEIVNYLKGNGFTVYLVTASDRMLMRAFASDVLGIPYPQVIGTDVGLTVKGEALSAEEKARYKLGATDEIVRDDTVRENANFRKVEAIEEIIGRKPVLSFGNSSGDYAMNTYVQHNNPHKSMVFMLLCDDAERAACRKDKNDERRALYDTNAWHTISMKDEFAELYLARPTAPESSSPKN